MRNVERIWEVWRSGQYIGDDRFSTRVTVERAYRLRTTDEATVGSWSRGPARWWQRADTAVQVETEVPNVQSVEFNRSTTSDAGTCDIIITNQMMPGYGEPGSTPGQFGSMGHFTWDHGRAPEARARWGHRPSSWIDVLTPNALIRTYQGFGGQDKDIAIAVAEGDLVLNGVWLVDDVQISTEGTVHLQCRDMAKLLIDQMLVPPLVPTELFPLLYDRWKLVNYKIAPDPPPGAGVCFDSHYGVGPAWHSSTDATYGEENTAHTGHRPGDAFDASVDPPNAGPGQIAHQATYWLSEPKSSASDHVWIEFGVTDGTPTLMNQIYFHAWGGHYNVQVSVWENGEWVPPEAGGQGGMTVDGIPFVSWFSPVWEGGTPPGLHTNQYALPRDYHASRIRLTITNLIKAQEGGYRAGARKIMACFNQVNASYPVLSFAGASMPASEGSDTVGYWQTRSNGRVFAFGDARLHDPNSPQAHHATAVIAMAAHPTGNGYWTLDISGRVVSYGSAQHYGDLEGQRDDAIDLAPIPNGNGYWILAKSGTVYTYGEGEYFGNASVSGTMPSGAPVIARSIESHPETSGYWVLLTNGEVQAFNLDWLGNAARDGFDPHGAGGGRAAFDEAEYVASIRRTRTGGGYWITSGGGVVQGFGDVGIVQGVPKGLPVEWVRRLCWDLIPFSGNDNGYAVVRADGHLAGVGTWSPYGSAGESSGTTRVDGNYKDYADIVRELLLWAGFYFYRDPQSTSTRPDVYGNIENTGIYGPSALPVEMFAKKPVIEAINDLTKIVGYRLWVDSEGAVRWESPNWWTMGNFLSDGTPFDYMPEIDESINLTSHSINFSAQSARSKITISTMDPLPTEAGQPPLSDKGTVTTEIIPPDAGDLRGMINPVMASNGMYLKPAEQKIMADLLAMRMWFERRRAQVTCAPNPLIDINDQVRVFERQTGEVFIHYVNGVQMSHNLQTGEASMTLDTHWMGGTPYGNPPYFFAAAARPQGDGYWQVNAFGSVYAFGAAQTMEDHQSDSHLDWVISMRSTPTGEGYYTIDTSGKILTYGDAQHQGQLHRSADDVTDMCLTPSGAGYWVLLADGTVAEFGDAVNYGNAAVSGFMQTGSPIKALSIEGHPSTMGYRVLLSNGDVQGFNLEVLGDANRDGYLFAEYTSCLRRTASGDGYWVVSGGGVVQAFGDATDLGDATRYPEEHWSEGLIWDILVNEATGGYAVQFAEGALQTFGFEYLGDALNSVVPVHVWPIVAESAYMEHPGTIPISLDVMNFLKGTASPSANNAVANGFGAPSDPTIKAT